MQIFLFCVSSSKKGDQCSPKNDQDQRAFLIEYNSGMSWPGENTRFYIYLFVIHVGQKLEKNPHHCKDKDLKRRGFLVNVSIGFISFVSVFMFMYMPALCFIISSILHVLIDYQCIRTYIF